MTTNLEHARKVGATLMPDSYTQRTIAVFNADQLDAFAERIRADAIAQYVAMTTNGAKAWADVPDATAWVDELRGGA